METRQMTPVYKNDLDIFHLLFQLHLYATLVFENSRVKVHIHMVPPTVKPSRQNTWAFRGKRLPIWTVHHSIILIYKDILWILNIYIIFVPKISVQFVCNSINSFSSPKSSILSICCLLYEWIYIEISGYFALKNLVNCRFWSTLQFPVV